MASQEERDRIMAEYLAQAGGDEDSEAEFDPNAHNDDDDDDDDVFDADDEEDEKDYIVLKGTIARHDGRLIYKGHVLAETFELKSKEDGVHWSVVHPTKTSSEDNHPSRMRTIEMEGNMGKKVVNVDLTLTQELASTNGKSGGAKRGQADDDDDNMKKPAAVMKDDNDGKMPSKPSSTEPAYVYTVYGKGTDGSEAFEFYGELDPSTAEKSTIHLQCKKRTVSAVPVAAAAAAAAPADEDDEDDADEGMDYDELIALHQDAGMSVEELRKRYHGGGDAGNDDEDAKPAAKKARTEQEEESDDDDEYGF